MKTGPELGRASMAEQVEWLRGYRKRAEVDAAFHSAVALKPGRVVLRSFQAADAATRAIETTRLAWWDGDDEFTIARCCQ